MSAMARLPARAAVAALALACFLAPAAAHYCSITGKVYCDACHDGKRDPPDALAKGVQVALTCDVGRGPHPVSTVYARTDADGSYVFHRVQTERSSKTFKGCTIKLVSTANDTCNILGKADPLAVLDPVKGELLQAGRTYAVPDLSFWQNLKSAVCPKGGSLCGNPRLVGGDGVPFWFHGRKDGDFCIVSDRNLHINAHFVGKATADGHDLTWVQALAVMFGKHRLYIGTQQEAVWHPAEDHLLFSLDGEVLTKVSNTHDQAVYQSETGNVKVTRSGTANWARIEVKNLLAIDVEVSATGRHQWTSDSCFAHLDMAFKFVQLSSGAEGVLGQSYQPLRFPPNIKVGARAESYTLHDIASFTASSLFGTDCPVSIFEALPYNKLQQQTHKLAFMDDVDDADNIAPTL
eukprot:SM000046S16424  [mRNA]  locus=s46:508864:510266:- [translate_table: standard]